MRVGTLYRLGTYDGHKRQGHTMDMAMTRILHRKSEVSDILHHGTFAHFEVSLHHGLGLAISCLMFIIPCDG